MRNAALWEQYSAARENLQVQLADRLRARMATLVGNMENADLLLVAADGRKLPAHECILRARAPGFYQRHVEATVSAMPRDANSSRIREVAIGDIDSAGLEFFIHSVYTEDEIARIPDTEKNDEDDDRRDQGSRSSSRSFQMDDSTMSFEDKGDDGDDERPRGDAPPSVDGPGAYHNASQNQSGYAVPTGVPMMTSFRDLAAQSPMGSSAYSLGGRSEIGPDIPEEGELDEFIGSRRPSKADAMMCKFIRLDEVSNTDKENEARERKRSSGGPKAIFPMFFGLGESGSGSGGADGAAPEGIRGRALLAKRLSVNSLTSLTSIDLTPSHEAPPAVDKTPSCRLASDLLQMYLDNVDTDVTIKTESGDLHAHKCILSATSPFFRQQLTKSKTIEMKGYSRANIHFLLSFIYGGLTQIPDEVDVWELVALATHLNMKDLAEVVQLHLRANKCHFFHRVHIRQ